MLVGRTLLVLGPTEMLLLGGFKPESIFVYWNDATEYEYARTRDVSSPDLLASLIAETQPGVIVASAFHVMPVGAPYRAVDLGRPGGYGVNVFLRFNATQTNTSDTDEDPN